MYVDEAKVDDDLKCPICSLPLFDPVTATCHMFCRACIDQHASGDPEALCPVDRQPLGSLTDVSGPTARPFLQMLGKIDVYCLHRRGDEGCQASLQTLDDELNHNANPFIISFSIPLYSTLHHDQARISPDCTMAMAAVLW